MTAGIEVKLTSDEQCKTCWKFLLTTKLQLKLFDYEKNIRLWPIIKQNNKITQLGASFELKMQLE